MLACDELGEVGRQIGRHEIPDAACGRCLRQLLRRLGVDEDRGAPNDIIVGLRLRVKPPIKSTASGFTNHPERSVQSRQ